MTTYRFQPDNRAGGFSVWASARSRAWVSAGTLAVSLAVMGLSGCSDAGTSASSIEAAGANATPAAANKVAVNTPTAASGYASAWGPGVGTSIPMLAAIDHAGASQNLASLSGEKGLLLVFSRSAEW